MSQEIKYDEAIKELEAMVSRFENAEIGVDELVGQIKRAGVLIKTCRQRLRVVEDEVQAALEELDSETPPAVVPAKDDVGDPFDDAPIPQPRKPKPRPVPEGGGLFGL